MDMRHTARLAAFLLAGLGVLLGSAVQAELGGYVAEIEKWREDFDADVRTGGWLTLVGRTKLDEGPWTLRSDPKSGLALPAKAPGELGILSRRGNAFHFEPAAGVAVTLGGKAVAGAVELPTKSGSDRHELSRSREVRSVRPGGNRARAAHARDFEADHAIGG
jgi:hypothetical protein